MGLGGIHKKSRVVFFFLYFFSLSLEFLMSNYRWVSICLLLCLTACQDVTAPVSRVVLTVMPDTVQPNREITQSTDWLEFQLTLSIKNEGNTDVAVPPCAAYLERKNGESWDTVWLPLCDLALRPPNILRAGKSVKQQLPVFAMLSNTGSPKWMSDSISGQYRVSYRAVVWSALSGGPSNTNAQILSSNEFTIIGDDSR